MLKNRIQNLVALGNLLQDKNNEVFVRLKERSERTNKWFTQEFLNFAVQSIVDNYLNEDKLNKWLSNYDVSSPKENLTVGLILAGNIPLVGMHDILCCYILGVNTNIKMSSKDEFLTKYVISELKKMDSSWSCEIVERLVGFDKVIATGSNNTNRYFEYYFKSVPSLLRKNRNSIAILSGNENKEELEALADDVFMFFGHGCRNVSKLFVPEGFDITTLFDSFKKYEHLHHHKLHMDNYDYNRTLLLMNQTEHFANEFIMLKEESKLQSRLATLHYSFYKKDEEVMNYLIDNHKEIQCVVGQKNEKWKSYAFGQAQKPELWDYADNVDTLEFLLK